MSRILHLTREDRFWIGVIITSVSLLTLITETPLVTVVGGFVLLLCSIPRKKPQTFIDLSEETPIEKVSP